MGRVSLTAAGARRRRALASGFRARQGWPRPGDGAPGTATSLCTGRSRACPRPSRASAQGLASRRSVAGGGLGSAGGHWAAQAAARVRCGEGWPAQAGAVTDRSASGGQKGLREGRGGALLLKGKGWLDVPGAGRAEEGAGVRKARCAGGAADSAGMLERPHPCRPPPSGCLDLPGSSAGASVPSPHSSPPDGCLWPATGFVVAPTQMPSETKSRCGFLAM